MSEVCQNCGGYYDTVFRVPTGVWEKLTGHADGGGLLCPACCDLLARRVGLELYWEAAVGEYPVAAERERCAKAADNWATHYKAQGKEAKFLALNHFAAVIRAGAGEGEQG